MTTEAKAREAVETYTVLVASAKKDLDRAMADLAEYSAKLAEAARYLAN